MKRRSKKYKLPQKKEKPKKRQPMIEAIVAIMWGWEKVYSQQRTALRAIRQAISMVCVIGRRTIARSYEARQEDGDWSSEYKLHSRSKWQEQGLFESVLGEVVWKWEGKFISMGCDDTRVKKSGKQIKTARNGRDPLSPPFHVNLMYGLRYLHASVLIPLHRQYGVSARALPVWFEEAPVLKKPGKKASEEEKKIYQEEKKTQNLSQQTLEMFKQMRNKMDGMGLRDKLIAWALDGSFCNKTIFLS